MGLHIEGTIGKDDIEEFLKLCKQRGWMVLGEPTSESSQIVYLDRVMIQRVVSVGKETLARVVGH